MPESSPSVQTAAVEAVGDARTLCGEVLEVDGDTCLVSAAGRLHDARRAVSCLIDLHVGDRVGLLVEGDGATHVLAVLTRAGSAPLRVSAPAGLAIEAGEAAEISLRSGSLCVAARQSRWLVGTLHLVAGELRGESRAIKWVSQLAHSIVDSLHVVAQRSFRHVQGSDHQRCGYLDIEAEELAQIKARNTMITARQLTRVDGAQIHVG